MKPQKYMNPITFEAEMFVSNLETLSKIHHQYDAVLVNSLHKLINTIETFLDSNPSEILATENTKLVACDNLNHIKTIYHCSNCKTDLGKSVEKVTLHLTEQCGVGAAVSAGGNNHQTSETNSVKDVKQRERKKSELRKAMLFKKGENSIDNAVKLSKKTCSLLTTDFYKFFAEQARVATKLKCMQDYDIIESDLMCLIKPLFANESIKIYKFGSRISGIGSRETDLDLYIDIGECFNVFKNKPSNETLHKLRIVANGLASRPNLWKGMVQVDKARVPIIKIIHAATRIECDINVSNSLGTVNTKFLEFLFNLQPLARLLSIFMKKWLQRTNLNHDMNTYSIVLMVIFYLQTQGVLPPVEKFQENVNQEKAFTVGPWLCSYATLSLYDLNIPLEDLGHPNLLKFIRGFFVFYTSYNYENYIICPYLGRPVKRVDLNNLMPNRYTEFVKTSPEYALQTDKALVVQDPIQLNHTVTKGLSAFTVKMIISFMGKSLDVINETFLF